MKEEDKKRLMRALKRMYRAQTSASSAPNKARSHLEKEPSRKERQKIFRKPVGKTGFILLFFGIISIVFSLTSASTILAFIGLTLTLWGSLFLFVLPSKYVKAEILDSMTISPISAINKTISNLKLHGKPVYLPPYPKDVYLPQPLKQLKEGSVFISAKNREVDSVIEQAFKTENKGLHITPPGLGLANLAEKELGTNFFSINLDTVKDILPTLFVNNLELADNLEMNTNKDLIHVRISKLKCKNLCIEANKLTNICPHICCPLASSIACILTRVTGKPLVIERCKPKNDVIETSYRIIEEA